MNYMMIRTDDMLNGDGLRVVLFCTACDHYCKNCHNPETWESSNGKLFDNQAKNEIFKDDVRDLIVKSIVKRAEEIYRECVILNVEEYNERDRKIDKILTSKATGIPIMFLLLGFIFWFTIVGVHYT